MEKVVLGFFVAHPCSEYPSVSHRLAEATTRMTWSEPSPPASLSYIRSFASLQWDLGEFKQKGTVATRWGTKAELLSASATAAKLGIGILIDGVLNVRASSA